MTPDLPPAADDSATFDSTRWKCVFVINADLPLGLITNTAAVLALSVGARLPIVGPDLMDGSGNRHAGLTTVPLPILKASPDVLGPLRERATSAEGCIVIDVSDVAQTTKNYSDYEALLRSRATETLKYLGLAIAGPAKTILKMTGNLPLLR